MLQDYQVFYLDNNIPMHKSFYCNNGDLNTRGLEVHVLENAQAKNCTGLTLKLIIRVPSGEYFLATATPLTIASGIYQVLFPNNMGKGRFIAELQLSEAGGNVLVSRKFSIVGDGSLTSDGSIKETPEGGLLWTALQNVDAAVAAKYAGLEAEYAEDLTEVKTSLAQIVKPILYNLDAYASFFGGSASDFVVGQKTLPTTTTAPATQGSTTLALADVSGLSAGVVLICNRVTPNQQLVSVISVSGNNVTITPGLAADVGSGSEIVPLWLNASHLTGQGVSAWGYWFANAKDDKGNYIIQGSSPKVTLFGDSWMAQNPDGLASVIKTRIPGATVINASVSGNKSADMIVRFATDVPTDSDYVIFNEPGVNDIYAYTPHDVFFNNFNELINQIRSINAIPIFTGVVPLSERVAQASLKSYALSDSVLREMVSTDIVINPVIGIGMPETDSIGIGSGSLNAITTGIGNVAVGIRALDADTSGSNNTAVGREALTENTTGQNNTAVGHNALRTNTSGGENVAMGAAALASSNSSRNTAIGYNAGVLLSIGAWNTFIGHGAGYQSGGDATGDATKTGNYQTLIGFQAGSADAINFPTAIGYRAKASNIGATAIGAGALASGIGAVAIGRDNEGNGATATIQNEFVLGTLLHTVKIPGRLNVGRKTPTGSADIQGVVGDITSDDNYVYAKTSTGWKRSALTTW